MSVIDSQLTGEQREVLQATRQFLDWLVEKIETEPCALSVREQLELREQLMTSAHSKADDLREALAARFAI